MGTLTVVATPIGNLGDLSPRAAETLGSADVVLAEDTRRTGRLLAHLGADVPQRSLHEHNEDDRVPEVLRWLDDGQAVALVSDAGTPGVSDPGYRLVRACLARGHEVVHVPGASAVLHALVVSGMPTDRFVFEGFLPRKASLREQRLAELARERRTVVVFAAPHRVADDLKDLAAACGEDRGAALCRELTKLHEQVWRAPLGELAGRAAAGTVRGEVTLVLAGAPEVAVLDTEPASLAAEVARRVAAGTSKKEAIREVARDSGAPRRDVYQAVLDEPPGTA